LTLRAILKGTLTRTELVRYNTLKIHYTIDPRIKDRPDKLSAVEDKVITKVENLLRLLEKEETKYEKLKNNMEKMEKSAKYSNDKLRQVQKENKDFKKNIDALHGQIEMLNIMLEDINRNYQISAEASVDLLSDLEYNKYKSRFIDIDIDLPPGVDKLKEYGKNIRQFFLEDLRCTYVFIHCDGITEDLKNLLHVNISKKQKDSASFHFDRTKVYYFDLEDIDLPERKLGRIIIGRYPYKSSRKENEFHDRIENEIIITKRLLEKCIIEIQNKELAIKDALTGLHSRKFLQERLTEEFNSMDIFSRLGQIEYNLLKMIIKSEGVAAPIVKNEFFIKYRHKDEVVFNKAISALKASTAISVDSVKYHGEWHDSYYFENSKMSYDLFVAILDLDHFKDVNDNWGGHSVGDRVLRDFAEILKKNIRTTDIPVRYGGEEFIIIFPRSTNYQRIHDVLDKIRQESENRLLVYWNGKRRNVTVSIGVARINKFDVNGHHIINRADAALYKAKKKRNRIILCEQDESGEMTYR
jgi:diguanylate cyclase (GGDEF)-like protein